MFCAQMIALLTKTTADFAAALEGTSPIAAVSSELPRLSSFRKRLIRAILALKRPPESQIGTQEKERLLLKAVGKRTQLRPTGYAGRGSIMRASLLRTFPTRLSTG
jgi:hypothetical protein